MNSATQNNDGAKNMTKELHNGTDGNGNTNYLVVTVDTDGSWKHIETFDTKAEALNWIKWA